MTDIPLENSTVIRLVATQFPELAKHQIQPLPQRGTDNYIYRIGENLCARFPKVSWATATAKREAEALPCFARSPIAVPKVYGQGLPGDGYAYDWSIFTWLPGMPLEDDVLDDQLSAAISLAEFFSYLRSNPINKRFIYGTENNGRGAPLETRSLAFQQALQKLPEIDNDFAANLWAGAIKADKAERDVWIHGDVHPGNVLIDNGKITGIIDWGLCGVGDGACDLLSAWAIFDQPARDEFRQAMGATDAEWLRGAGWALSMAVIYLPYAHAKGLRSDMSEQMISRLIEDFA